MTFHDRLASRSRWSCWIGWSIPIQTLAICHWTACLTYLFVLFSQMYMNFMYWTDLFELLHYSFGFIRLSFPYMNSAFSSPIDGSWTWRRHGCIVNTKVFWTRALLFSSSLVFLGESGNEPGTKCDYTLSRFGLLPSFRPLPKSIQWHSEAINFGVSKLKKIDGFLKVSNGDKMPWSWLRLLSFRVSTRHFWHSLHEQHRPVFAPRNEMTRASLES